MELRGETIENKRRPVLGDSEVEEINTRDRQRREKQEK